MDGYILHPPAQDSATAGYSSAAKGGLAGVLVMHAPCYRSLCILQAPKLLREILLYFIYFVS